MSQNLESPGGEQPLGKENPLRITTTRKIPTLTPEQKEMYKLCTQVLELEMEEDDDNARELFYRALELVKRLRTMIK